MIRFNKIVEIVAFVEIVDFVEIPIANKIVVYK